MPKFKNKNNFKNKDNFKNKSDKMSGLSKTSRLARPSKNVILQVLWTGVEENVPSLFMLTESKRYVFNTSEGIQRLFTERRMRIGKLDTFFFTQHKWTHLGGFPGFAMTLRDAKSALNQETEDKEKKKQKQKQKKGGNLLNVNVHGPEGMKRILDAAHRFMKFDKSGMRLFTHEHGKNTKSSIYEDMEMKIFPFPITGSIPVSHGGASLSNHRLLEPLMPSLSQSPPALCFACHLKPLPGKFNVEKAVKLGIPKGYMFGDLQRGMKVTLSDGREIQPSDVIGEEIPGVNMLVIDCPTTSYIDSLVKNTAIQKYRSKDQQAHLIIHLAKEEICSHKDYTSWVKKFPEETRHVFVKDIPKTSVAFRGQHSLQILLNHVQPEIFPIIDRDVQIANELTSTQEEGESMVNFTKLNIREVASKGKGDPIFDNTGFKRIKRTELLEKAQEILKPFNNNDSTKDNDVLNINGKRPIEEEEVLDNKKQQLQNGQPLPKSGEYPRVVCLGTGAALPSKYRNVSATLVFMSENDAVLFDCGEDTLGQLSRHYGNNLDAVISKIKMILVSHLHADHHLGLFSVLRRIISSGGSGVVIVAPFYYRDWFMQYAETSEVLNCQFVPVPKLERGGSWLSKDIHVQSVKVEHPASAFGFIVKNKIHSVVYSGDTKPCQALINAGKGCTLLIHEATLEDGLEGEALTRLHSTTSQALTVAQKMEAKHLLLNHFSQRYPKIPDLQKNEISHQTAIAFDHMELSMKDIPKFQDFIPKLQKLFDVGQEEEEREELEGEDENGNTKESEKEKNEKEKGKSKEKRNGKEKKQENENEKYKELEKKNENEMEIENEKLDKKENETANENKMEIEKEKVDDNENENKTEIEKEKVDETENETENEMEIEKYKEEDNENKKEMETEKEQVGDEEGESKEEKVGEGQEEEPKENEKETETGNEKDKDGLATEE